jgi:hypothetical protein
MAPRQLAEAREVLDRKLRAVDDHIAFWERQLGHLQTEVSKVLLDRPRDAVSFAVEVCRVLREVWKAGPSRSLIQQDLDEALDQMNSAYSQEQERLIEQMVAWDQQLDSGVAADDPRGSIRAMSGKLDAATVLFDWALAAARRLREQWIDQLNASASAPPAEESNRFAKRGRDWEVRFEGVNASFRDAVGMFYINHLLHHPDGKFTPTELRRVWCAPGSRQVHNGTACPARGQPP